VWGPAPGLSYPVLYFAVHDDRPAEGRSSAGVVPYDWLFRVDPFTGVIDPVAASADLQSEGAFGLAANSHYLALTLGCCTAYEVDALDLTQPAGALKVLARPPTQPALFTEGAAPGADGLVAVRAFGTGAWYFLNPDAGVLNAFPLKLGPDDGPVAFSPDGTLVAVSLPDQGPVIEPIRLTPASPAATASIAAGATPSASARPATPSPATTPSPPPAPHHVNSKIPHADALAWSPDQKQLALAVSGEIDVYSAAGADGTPPSGKYLSASGVIGIDWSGPIPSRSLAVVKPGAGPQGFVDGLLTATMLPPGADSAAARPLTKVYLWQFDSNKASPIANIADATPAVLQQYPPLAASVNFHHWLASGTWVLVGGCYRYRVVVTGSVAPVASTFGLASSTPCNAPPSPSPTQAFTPTPTK